MESNNVAHESRKAQVKTREEKARRKKEMKPTKPIYRVMNNKIIQETTVNGNVYRTYCGKATKQNLEELKARGYKIG